MKKIQDLMPGVPVILADGLFPISEKVLTFLKKASMIICCDGATVKLLKFGLKPHSIVGDMDSLPQKYRYQFKDIIVASEEQETNDFTKAVNAAIELGLEQVVVLGATGQREDHTLGNIGLLVEHGQKLQMQILTDYGVFTPVYESSVMSSFPGQQISIFSILGTPQITSANLKYPLCQMSLNNWWCGTLNEAQSAEFSLDFEKGGLVVYRAY